MISSENLLLLPNDVATSVALRVAQANVAAGLSIIPIRDDGSKRPALEEWTTYQNRLPTYQEITAWFRNNEGMALICGDVSGGVECLDFDDPLAIKPWADTVSSELQADFLKKLTLTRTPSGGYHIPYRCTEIAGNMKLAQKLIKGSDGKPKIDTMIETRGQGGYFIIPPTPARYHPAGRPWRLLRGDLTHLPTISPHERSVMLDVAMAMNRYERPMADPRSKAQSTSAPEGDRIGDWYNENAEWDEILIPPRWKLLRERSVGMRLVRFWQRPDKSGEGCSATTGWGDYDVLYVFSTNAWPFEANTGYTKFTALALLNFGGDYTAAARHLYAKQFNRDGCILIGADGMRRIHVDEARIKLRTLSVARGPYGNVRKA